MEKLWYRLSREEVLTDLASDPQKGLSARGIRSASHCKRTQRTKRKSSRNFNGKNYCAVQRFLIIILIGASVVSAFIGEVTDALVIIAIVIINAILGVVQESKAEKALEALQKMAAPCSKVIRDGDMVVVPSRELVAGDVVILEAGDYIPADVRILESINLKVEEAALTGESVPVDKEALTIEKDVPLGERHNMGFMSTVATYGRGKAIVVQTGMFTEIGKIAEMIQSFGEQDTPLQKKLEEFGKVLGILCLVVCALVFVLGVYDGYRDGTLDAREIQFDVHDRHQFGSCCHS